MDGTGPGRGPGPDRQASANLSVIAKAFSRCRSNGNDGMPTDDYLGACNELIRLFDQLGGGLGLALRGVEPAVKMLEFRRVSGASCHYQRLEWMLRHEREQAASGRDGSSGIKSLETLQAALSFMIAVLEALSRTLRLERLGTCDTWDLTERIRVYDSTMGPQHSFVVQTGVKAALAIGATRRQVMKNLSAAYRGDLSMQHLLETVVKEATPVYQKVQAIHDEYTSLDLAV